MKYETDEDGYVNFGDVSRNELGMQCQYGARYLANRNEGVFSEAHELGRGLRFKNLDVGNYHGIMVHIDDIPELVRRYKEWKKEYHRIYSGRLPLLHRLFFGHKQWEKEYTDMLCGENIPRWKKLLFFR